MPPQNPKNSRYPLRLQLLVDLDVPGMTKGRIIYCRPTDLPRRRDDCCWFTMGDAGEGIGIKFHEAGDPPDFKG